MQSDWLALVIGNSRLHWASFIDGTLYQTWDTAHGVADGMAILPKDLANLLQKEPELWLASVVPVQTPVWQRLPHTHLITLNQVPLGGMYSTFGIDRALTLWGAITHLGSPALVIDAGTALTFTGADHTDQLIGGAILPGLQLQLQSLHQGTAALPAVDLYHQHPLPPRWASTTADAIVSGILYTLLAGLRERIGDWLTHYPDSQIAITGGDRDFLIQLLAEDTPDLAAQIIVEPNLFFWGIQALRQPTLKHLT